MPTIRIRLTGSADHASELMSRIHSLDGIDHVEEVDDLMPHLDDDDSSSAGLVDDIGPGLHDIEVEAPHERAARRVRVLAEEFAVEHGVPIEIVDEF